VSGLYRNSKKRPKSGYPRDLREMVPSGKVVVSYLPDAFDWSYGHREMVLRIDAREMVLNSHAGRCIKRAAEAAEDGSYRAAIGVARKAVAIRVLPPDQTGYKLRCKSSGSDILKISGAMQIAKALGVAPGTKIPLAWDEENKMLVGKLSKPDKPDLRACGQFEEMQGNDSAVW